MNDSLTPDTKILFTTPENDGSIQTETLWATSLGGDQYKLDNSPFYAYSVSWEDIIYAPYDPSEERPTFQYVVKKSGNRTVRIIFDHPVEDGNLSEQILKGLVDLGCSYEGIDNKYISINIPPETELQLVLDYLIAEEVKWEHADPHYSELFPDGS